jgi:hypothetical protein
MLERLDLVVLLRDASKPPDCTRLGLAEPITLKFGLWTAIEKA